MCEHAAKYAPRLRATFILFLCVFTFHSIAYHFSDTMNSTRNGGTHLVRCTYTYVRCACTILHLYVYIWDSLGILNSIGLSSAVFHDELIKKKKYIVPTPTTIIILIIIKNEASDGEFSPAFWNWLHATNPNEWILSAHINSAADYS